MKKLSAFVLIAFMTIFTTMAFASSTTTETDYRQGGTNNSCLQTAEYVDDKWVNMTDRQLESQPIYIVELFTPHKLVFGGVNLRYTKTSKGNYDYYRGNFDNGKSVVISMRQDARDTLFVDIEGMHMKSFYCIQTDDQKASK